MSSSTCFLYQVLLVYSNVLLLPDFGPFGLWKIDCKFAFNIYIYVDMIYDISLDPDVIFSQETSEKGDIYEPVGCNVNFVLSNTLNRWN